MYTCVCVFCIQLASLLCSTDIGYALNFAEGFKAAVSKLFGFL